MKYVYLLRDANGFYKIGISEDMSKRISNLNRSHPHSLSIVSAKLVKNATDLENWLHEKYIQSRTKTDNDWYELSPEDALNICIEINNAEEDEYRYKVKQIEELHQALLIKYKELSEQIILLKGLILSIKSNIKISLEWTGKSNEYQNENKQTTKKPDKNEEEQKLLERAKVIVLENNRASASLLQRKLQIGYARAARVLDTLESQGFVSSQNEVGVRNILIG